jgi:apolipoprotein N-acyltransferase
VPSSTSLRRRLIGSETARAALGGLALAVSAPPFPVALIFCAFVSVVLLASALEGATIRQGAVRGLFFGLFCNLVAMSFVPTTITRFTDLPWAAAIVGWILLSLGQGAVWAVCGFVTSVARRFRVPLAPAFALGVAASMLLPSLFPWTIAAPFARAPVFLQLAEALGERGVAIFLAITAGTFVTGFRTLRGRVLTAAAIAALPLYGLIRMPSVDRVRAAAPTMKVALIQQAVAPKERWKSDQAANIVVKLWTLTRAAEEQGAELSIWPEAAYPYVLPHHGGIDGGVFRIRGGGVKGSVLTGLLTEAPAPEGSDPGSKWHYNAATLADASGRIAPAAAKIELLAFGEVVPLGDKIPVIRRMFARGGGLVPGVAPVLLSSGAMRAGILNCYEDTLPALSRRVAAANPNLIVNLTNDAWFGASAEPELHLLEAIPRAIEARRDLVRAVNTGVTVHVDALGRVVARAPREVATFLLVKPALIESPPTVYTRFGDLTWGIPLLLFAIVSALHARRT